LPITGFAHGVWGAALVIALSATERLCIDDHYGSLFYHAAKPDCYNPRIDPMRLNLDRDNSKNIIRAYTVGSITINEYTVERSVIVTPTRMINDWPPQRFIELEASHMAQIATLQPEIVLLGTGARQQFPAPQVTHRLLALGIGVEVMDTAAACRTYNIVMLEGRQVAAALLII
jgi:uncharacterized protein